MKHANIRIALRSALMAVALVALTVAGGSCSKNHVIPDKELEVILREMFLTNAIVTNQRLDVDSAEIYHPILEKHGYTEDDFFMTLANFQKRKSARLSHVLENTITSLENLSAGYEQNVRDLKYIDSLAKSQCISQVYFKERVRVTRLKDTARLKITLPIKNEGEYRVSYNYFIDTLDVNERLQSSVAVFDTLDNRTYYVRHTLSKGERKKALHTIVPKPASKELYLQLADYALREDEPNITIDSLEIRYIPSSEVALRHMDSLMQFRPSIVLSDSVEIYHTLEATVPLLPADTLKAMAERAAAEAKEAKKKSSRKRK